MLKGQQSYSIIKTIVTPLGSRASAVVRMLDSRQCVQGSIPWPGDICGLGLLLVLFSAPRVFLRVPRFSYLLKNQHFQIPIVAVPKESESARYVWHLNNINL